MADKNIEHIAEGYADAHFLDDVGALVNKPWHEAKELYTKTLVDFAVHAISHQWVRADERLPKDERLVYAAFSIEGYITARLAFYSHRYSRWVSFPGTCTLPDVAFWIEVPPTPQLDAEKEER